MINQDLLDFMMDIRFNNNKEFMATHRQEYIEKVRTPYYQLIEALTPTMLDIDPHMEVRPAKCLSRIFRDTRFSKDKSPYRDHHWVAFRHESEPRDQAVMFWFEIRIEAVSWGLGFWGENKAAMDLLRQRMIAFPADLTRLLPLLKQHDFALEGEMYKRMKLPSELNKELNTWYLRKELLLIKQNISPQIVFMRNLTEQLQNDFYALKPFYDLFRGCYELGKISS